MHVDVNVTRSDLIWLNLSQCFRLRSNIYLFLTILILVTVFVWLSAKPDPDGIDWIALAIASGITTLVTCGILVAVSIFVVLLNSTGRAGVLGKHSYTIEDAGLREATVANDSLHFWPAIAKVENRSRAILVQINAYLFHVLPRREFQSDDQFEAFYRSLADRCGDARSR